MTVVEGERERERERAVTDSLSRLPSDVENSWQEKQGSESVAIHSPINLIVDVLT